MNLSWPRQGVRREAHPSRVLVLCGPGAFPGKLSHPGVFPGSLCPPMRVLWLYVWKAAHPGNFLSILPSPLVTLCVRTCGLQRCGSIWAHGPSHDEAQGQSIPRGVSLRTGQSSGQVGWVERAGLGKPRLE